jgi:protein SCO1/2
MITDLLNFWLTILPLVVLEVPGLVAVQPAPLPNVLVTLHDGHQTTLREALGRGRFAVQLMYTECETTCPLLGGLFRKVDQQLEAEGADDLKLVSITVNPEHDQVEDLARWRQELKASQRWVAIRADRGELVQILGTLRESDHDPKSHSRRVYIVEGRPSGPVFVGVTREFPTAKEIVDALRGR